jgi:hypothetical protein
MKVIYFIFRPYFTENTICFYYKGQSAYCVGYREIVRIIRHKEVHRAEKCSFSAKCGGIRSNDWALSDYIIDK